ncbi:MAG: ATP-binding protein [Planctomycetales bacterium]|nr:MAG: ATP-binding protein [Planctomycetales bacterium]
MNASPHEDVGGTVGIRPGVSILSVLRHLNYRPWYAIAEFVDNSLQSYLAHKLALQDGRQAIEALRVEISLENDPEPRLVITDNAAGISALDFPRAFRPAAIPTDTSGLSEFGMGMKSAACWFSPRWIVRTKALGEPVERIVTFNIAQIIKDEIEELAIETRPSKPEHHFTEIQLLDLHEPPQGRTVAKIKEHLASIYRMFIRNGEMNIFYKDKELSFDNVGILNAPYYKEPSSDPVTWFKKIDMDFGAGHRVTGFAALRDPGSTTHAGFALFRRNRLIQGSADDGYRPYQVFGAPNRYPYQRLFGELHMEGFEVSHTKDGFRWDDGLEDTFLELLKEELNSAPLPLITQAENFRARKYKADWRSGAEKAVANTADTLEKEAIPVLETERETPPSISELPSELDERTLVTKQERTLEFRNDTWQVTIELTSDAAVSDWLEIRNNEQQPVTADGRVVRHLGIRISLEHPFMQRFCGLSSDEMEPLIRLAVGIALSEVVARESGVLQAGTFRRVLNDLLANALAL